jgi:hypothetical protein
MTVLCPKTACDVQEFENPSALAAHLIDAHLMSGLAALTLARQTAGEVRAAAAVHPNSAKETPMAKNEDRTGECPECHRLRHGKDCSQHFRRKKQAPPAAAAKKRKPITRRHPLPPKRKAGAATGARPVDRAAEVAAVLAVHEALESFAPDAQRRLLRCVCVLLSLDLTTLAP